MKSIYEQENNYQRNNIKGALNILIGYGIKDACLLSSVHCRSALTLAYQNQYSIHIAGLRREEGDKKMKSHCKYEHLRRKISLIAVTVI